MDTQDIMQRISEAQAEERQLAEELSGIDEKIRNDTTDFGLQRAGIAEGRGDRTVREVLSEERDHMRELRARREELPYEVHAATAHRLRLEVKRFEQQEAEAEERLVEASKKAEPLREKVEKLKAELEEAEAPLNTERANMQMAQSAGARKRDELDSHLNATVRRLPEFVPANTRV